MTDARNGAPAGDEARLEIDGEGEGRRLRFSGRIDGAAAAALWDRAERAGHGARPLLDLGAVEAIDTTGAALLVAAGGGRDGVLRVENAGPRVGAVLDRVVGALGAPSPPAPPAPPPPVARLGRAGVAAARAAGQGVAFLGEVAVTGLGVLRHPGRVRRFDLLRQLDAVGTRAFPLTLLLGVLIGVILAFQSSIPMRQFGAELFIPRLVGISLLRELGPLMAGVILAGRTGSAFAAEIGTMTVNEEVDALRIMGVDPVAMLAVPRLIAATVAMPVLTLLMDLAGLLGMTAVMATLGFPPAAVANQLAATVAPGDLLGGLGKAAVFGLVIAAIGCRAGLGAGRGPRAVGDAATSAVVGGIVAIVLLDGLFAVLFFRLGW